MVFEANHLKQNGAHHVKGYGKLSQKMMSFLVYYLFEVTWAFCKKGDKFFRCYKMQNKKECEFYFDLWHSLFPNSS